jgi:hypothetical protein
MMIAADALAASSAAGLATAIASVITAAALLVGAFGVLVPQLRKTGAAIARVDETLNSHKESIDAATVVAAGAAAETSEVHTLVNQRQTDMLRYQAALVLELEKAGGVVPVDQSLLPIERRRGVAA